MEHSCPHGWAAAAELLSSDSGSRKRWWGRPRGPEAGDITLWPFPGQALTQTVGSVCEQGRPRHREVGRALPEDTGAALTLDHFPSPNKVSKLPENQ